MPKKPESIQFTRPEIDHVFSAMNIMEMNQSYYGRRDQYWARHERILSKLRIALEVPDAGS